MLCIGETSAKLWTWLSQRDHAPAGLAPCLNLGQSELNPRLAAVSIWDKVAAHMGLTQRNDAESLAHTRT